MSKFNFRGLINSSKAFVGKHSPEILTGIGIAGMLTTVVLAVQATPKATRLIDERKDELETEKLPVGEIVKTTWKCYVPTAISGATSIACLIGAHSVNAKRNAALATAYKLSETALSEYKDKVIEVIGEKKEHAIREKVAEEKIKKDPVSKKEVIITSRGETLCYDAISGRYFKSDMETIKRAENEINSQMVREMYASLNDFYDCLDLSHTKIGDDLGWSMDDGLLEIDFSSHLTDDGTPCLVVSYSVAPKYDYYKFT